MFGQLSDLACDCGCDNVDMLRFGEPYERHERLCLSTSVATHAEAPSSGRGCKGSAVTRPGRFTVSVPGWDRGCGRLGAPRGRRVVSGLDAGRGRCSRAAPDMQVPLALLVGEGARELVLGDLDEVR